ncbi:hypothetical protein GCM10027280_34650 [Micromonospora polyrhachis]|uniref:Uncharacterized protein n=1 Tax=Micromonospora polyrhachis TaxID=1282883 RepID=A0A7W7WPP8_9ACTN|nr:hypothetical protein [Micromonospora polyrhachis]MBB4959461.1 hypothetical protein [Micromonospora polyrhachis]
MDQTRRRPLRLFLALAGILALLGVGAGIAQAAVTKKPPRKVKASVRFDQVSWEKVPGLGGNVCIKTRVQGTIKYEYLWVLGLRPQPGRPQKTFPVLNKTTIVAPQVTVSAWSKCSGSGRKAVKLNGTSFEQRWLNSNECSMNGLSLSAGGYPFAAYIGTTINCGETRFLGRKSNFSKKDNDYRESNSNTKINIKSSALQTKGSRATGEWHCARLEVGGRVIKSNKNDNFGHVFFPCIHLPAERNA